MRAMVALSCALVLGCGVAAAQADAIVPTEGPWHARSSADLPVSFEVSGGQVLNARFRFRWGFCGTFETASQSSVQIEPTGHWKYLDPRGPWIEGSFVAPDRVEGTITAPSRMLPGCPETHATFVAEPGAAPFETAESVVLADVRNHRLVHAPHSMVFKSDGSFLFYDLRWHGFGNETARASGRAYLRRGGVVRRPRVTVALTELTQQGDYRVYLELHYVLHGRVPPGRHHRGSIFLG